MRRVLLNHQLPVQPGMCWLMFYPFLLAGSRSDGNLEGGHWKDLMWRVTAMFCKIPVVKAYLVIVSFPFLIIDQLCEILDHIRHWNCQIKVLMRPVYDSLISRNLFAAFSSSGLRSGWYCMESRSQASLQLNRTRWMAPTGEYWSSLSMFTWFQSWCTQGEFQGGRNGSHSLSAVSPSLGNSPG